MLLRLLLILVVALAFVSVELGAAKKNKKSDSTDSQSSCTTNCTAAAEQLQKCLESNKGKKSYKKYNESIATFDFKKLTKLTNKLIKKRCIPKKSATDVKCLMEILTPPDFYTDMYKDLSPKDKKALKKYAANPNDAACKAAADAVTEKVQGEMGSLSADETSELMGWAMGALSSCIEMSSYAGMLQNYANGALNAGSSNAADSSSFMNYYGR